MASTIYDEIFETNYNYIISVIQKNEMFGYLQSDGKELVTPIYEEAFDVFDFALEPLEDVN
ncbi:MULTISPECIES: WG repeat-containing protein [Chryseobacterium]|uniref:WG repeat-containing protein n=1 Tax=Chryseobacterium TaxID=59732 RepID=UPI000C9DA992|nr:MULTISPECIES: WG repeat-containing protein [Chryseobacterium]VXB39603.1 hypothetical protein CHRYSEO8AT_250028 [Chryseobacterium sp. 8AT]